MQRTPDSRRYAAYTMYVQPAVATVEPAIASQVSWQKTTHIDSIHIVALS